MTITVEDWMASAAMNSWSIRVTFSSMLDTDKVTLTYPYDPDNTTLRDIQEIGLDFTGIETVSFWMACTADFIDRIDNTGAYMDLRLITGGLDYFELKSNKKIADSSHVPGENWQRVIRQKDDFQAHNNPSWNNIKRVAFYWQPSGSAGEALNGSVLLDGLVFRTPEIVAIGDSTLSQKIYGIRELYLVEKGVWEVPGAQEIADAIVMQLAYPTIRSQGTLAMVPSILPGQQATVPILSGDINLLVEKINVTVTGNKITTTLTFGKFIPELADVLTTFGKNLETVSTHGAGVGLMDPTENMERACAHQCEQCQVGCLLDPCQTEHEAFACPMSQMGNVCGPPGPCQSTEMVISSCVNVCQTCSDGGYMD